MEQVLDSVKDWTDKIDDTELNVEKLATPMQMIIKLPAKELDVLLDEYFSVVSAQTATMKGFRPGKTPKDLLIKKAGGWDKFYEPVLHRIAIGLFEKRKLRVCAYDQLNAVKVKDEYVLICVFYVMPLFYLPEEFSELKEIVVEPIDGELAGKRTEIEIERILRQLATATTVQRPIKVGDVVRAKIKTGCGKKVVKDRCGVFTIEILDKGVENKQWWNDLVIGLEVGKIATEFDYVITDENHKFFDKQVKSIIYIEEVQEVKMPEVTAALIEKLGFKTESEWRSRVFHEQFGVLEDARNQQVIMQILDRVGKKGTADPIPFSWIQNLADNHVNQVIQKYGERVVCNMYQVKSKGDLFALVRNQAIAEIKDDIIINAFARKFELNVDEPGWQNEVRKRMMEYITIKEVKENGDEEKIKALKELEYNLDT